MCLTSVFLFFRLQGEGFVNFRHPRYRIIALHVLKYEVNDFYFLKNNFFVPNKQDQADPDLDLETPVPELTLSIYQHVRQGGHTPIKTKFPVFSTFQKYNGVLQNLLFHYCVVSQHQICFKKNQKIVATSHHNPSPSSIFKTSKLFLC